MTIKDVVVELTVDYREAPSGLIDELMAYKYTTTTMHVSTRVTVAQLPVGDVICSDRLAVERKSVRDYVDTFVDPERDLFGQARDMLRAYPKSIMIIEGGSIFGLRQIHPEALRGSMLGLAVDIGLPLIPTQNITQTAAYMVSAARREQFDHKRSVSMHGGRSKMNLPQRQRYIISSIGSGVGDKVADDLLHHFKSVQSIMNASMEELIEVPGIGVEISKKIRELVSSEYKV